MDDKRNSGLLGLRIGSNDLGVLLDGAMRSVAERHPPFTFACANPHSLVVAQSHSRFRAALQACTAVVADGIGVVVAGRIVGCNVGPRITGEDFFFGVMSRLNRRGGRVFFLGSTDAVLDRIVLRARRDFPNLYVDVLSPPFGTWDDSTNERLIDRIREARADVLWVGMTAPKQECWVHANAPACAVPLVGSIGAVFDFYAQTVPRAPMWMCRLGLEWLYRLIREPGRLWRRTFISAPQFLWLVLKRHVL